jgi:hypothetical protein
MTTSSPVIFVKAAFLAPNSKSLGISSSIFLTNESETETSLLEISAPIATTFIISIISFDFIVNNFNYYF